ncbi:MAG TPA: GNAT family N-acetyltransferase [Bdellovibrionota bacterium]|jgi:ribosomal-protein-alanine N-acetyltransferase|nr:GNAT family N-acetyltransferase [Bdellovibrionota bacterium]
MLRKDLTLKEQVEMLMAIDQARAKPGQDFSWPFESFQSELTSEQSRFFEWSLHPEGDELDGFVITRLGFDGECEIMHMACKRHGRGYDMLRDWIRWAKLQGLRKVFLEFHENNTPAQRLYERMGFEKISERPRYYRDGGKAILMSLDLTT